MFSTRSGQQAVVGGGQCAPRHAEVHSSDLIRREGARRQLKRAARLVLLSLVALVGGSQIAWSADLGQPAPPARRTNHIEKPPTDSIAASLSQSENFQCPELKQAVVAAFRVVEDRAAPHAQKALRDAWRATVPGKARSLEVEVCESLVAIPPAEKDQGMGAFLKAIDNLCVLVRDGKDLENLPDHQLRRVAARCAIVQTVLTVLVEHLPGRIEASGITRADWKAAEPRVLEGLTKLSLAGTRIRDSAVNRLKDRQNQIVSLAHECRGALRNYDKALAGFMADLGPLVIAEARNDPFREKFFHWFLGAAHQSPVRHWYLGLPNARAPWKPGGTIQPDTTVRGLGQKTVSLDVRDLYRLVPWPYALAEYTEMGTIEPSYSIHQAVLKVQPDAVILGTTIKVDIRFRLQSESGQLMLPLDSHKVFEKQASFAWAKDANHGKEAWLHGLLLNQQTANQALLTLNDPKNCTSIVESICESVRQTRTPIEPEGLLGVSLTARLTKGLLPVAVARLSVDTGVGVGKNDSQPGDASQQRDCSVLDSVLAALDSTPTGSSANSSRAQETWQQLKKQERCLMAALEKLATALPVPRQGEQNANGWNQARSQAPESAAPAQEAEEVKPPELIPARLLVAGYVERYGYALADAFRNMLREPQVLYVHPILAGAAGDDGSRLTVALVNVVGTARFLDDLLVDALARQDPIFPLLVTCQGHFDHSCLAVLGLHYIDKREVELLGWSQMAALARKMGWKPEQAAEDFGATLIGVPLDNHIDPVGDLYKLCTGHAAEPLAPDAVLIAEIADRIVGTQFAGGGPILAAMAHKHAYEKLRCSPSGQN